MLRFYSPYKTLSHQRYTRLCLTSLAFAWLFFSSCHIEKRHYRQGFHIEMPSAKHQVKNTSLAQREVITYRSIPRKAPVQLQAPIVFEKPYPVQAAEYKPPRPLRKTDDQAGEPETEFTIQEDSPPAGKREPTVHRLAVFSFILGLLALGLAVFVIYGLAILAIPAVLMAKAALRDIKKRPDIHKGKGWARLGIILGLAALAAVGIAWAVLGG